MNYLVVFPILFLGVAFLAYRLIALGRRSESLTQRLLEVEKLLKQRGNLANEIAHEIKNPLTAILCSAEALDHLIGEKLDPDHRKSLRYIREYGDNLLRLVSDFLDISRAESHVIESHPEPVRIMPLIESVIGLLQSNALKKHIAIKCYALHDQLVANVDPKHFKQIIFNLIHNAIKFTPERGQIDVVVKNDFPSPFIRLEVKDNGIGIAAEDLEFVFDPYKMLDRKSSMDTGAGLGLALCKSLLELNSGQIKVRSEPKVGTSFEVSLPIGSVEVTQSSALTQSQTRIIMHPLMGQRYLVLDKDPVVLQSISDLIKAWGGVVDQVQEAKSALDALAHTEYDAVMIDAELEGINVGEFAKSVKQHTAAAETAVILTTQTPIVDQLKESTCVDKCLEKPLNGKVLLDSLINTGKYTLPH